MKPVDVIVPTRRPYLFLTVKSFQGLPVESLHIIRDGDSWVDAVNKGIRESKNDVLIMDDDIKLQPRTFSLLEGAYPAAEIFGFKLLFPDNTIQHAGGMVSRLSFRHRFYKEPDIGQADHAKYVPHCTASLLLVKRDVFKTIGGFQKLAPGGMSFEDVDFSFAALLAGFNTMYLPGPAIHYESAYKKRRPFFKARMYMNAAWLAAKYYNNKRLWEIINELQ